MYRALRIVHILSVACFALFAVAICSLLVLASIFPHIEEGRAKAGIPSGDMHFFLRSDDPPGCYAQGFILETVVCHKIPDAHKKNILLSIPSEIVLYPFVSVISLLTDLDPWIGIWLLGLASLTYLILAFLVFPIWTMALVIRYVVQWTSKTYHQYITPESDTPDTPPDDRPRIGE